MAQMLSNSSNTSRITHISRSGWLWPIIQKAGVIKITEKTYNFPLRWSSLCWPTTAIWRPCQSYDVDFIVLARISLAGSSISSQAFRSEDDQHPPCLVTCRSTEAKAYLVCRFTRAVINDGDPETGITIHYVNELWQRENHFSELPARWRKKTMQRNSKKKRQELGASICLPGVKIDHADDDICNFHLFFVSTVDFYDPWGILVWMLMCCLLGSRLE